MEGGFKMKEKYIKFYQNFHKAFDGKSNHCSEIIQEDQFSILGISREQRLQTVFPDMLDFLQRHREEFREKERNA